MNICLLSESSQHPVLDEVVHGLRDRHWVAVRDPRTPGERPAEAGNRPADIYLLKSRSPGALEFAHAAERAGALVINGPGPTAKCLDRVATAVRLTGHVDAPRTWTFESLAWLAGAAAIRHALPWPLVVKSRYSRRNDLVRLVRDPADLDHLLPSWGTEPVIAQEFAPNDGFDVKVWVIGGEVTVARRPCALETRSTSHDVPINPAALPSEWRRLALRAGALLGLDLFGVDLVISSGRPLVVDVNAFPGFRSVPGAGSSIVALIERLALVRKVSA